MLLLRDMSGLILAQPLAYAMGITIPASEASAIATMVPPSLSTLTTSIVPESTSTFTTFIVPKHTATVTTLIGPKSTALVTTSILSKSTATATPTATVRTSPFDPNGGIDRVDLSEDAQCRQNAIIAQTNWRATCNKWNQKLFNPFCWSRCPSEPRCCGEGEPIKECRTFMEV